MSKRSTIPRCVEVMSCRLNCATIIRNIRVSLGCVIHVLVDCKIDLGTIVRARSPNSPGTGSLPGTYPEDRVPRNTMRTESAKEHVGTRIDARHPNLLSTGGERGLRNISHYDVEAVLRSLSAVVPGHARSPGKTPTSGNVWESNALLEFHRGGKL